MVRVYTDHPELLNDLGEVIRLYLPHGGGGSRRERRGRPLHFGCDGGGRRDVARCLHCRYGRGAGRVRLLFHPNVGGGELNRKRYRKRCMKIAVFRALGKVYKDARLPWGSLTGMRRRAAAPRSL